MRHGNKNNKLGRNSAHRNALLKNLAHALFEHGYIATTLAKAKELRPFAEKIITKAIKVHKAETIARRVALSRQIERDIHQYEVYLKLINVWGMLCLHRPGGDLRIIKLESRMGDNAEMAYIGIVLDENYTDEANFSGIAAKSMFTNLSKSLVTDHLINKSLLAQWYNARIPQINMQGKFVTTQNRKIITFEIFFHGVELEDANWPVFNREYVDLPVSLHIDTDLPDNANVEYKVKAGEGFRIMPSYNEKSIIRILLSPLKETKIIKGEIIIGRRENVMPRLEYCYLTIRGPISDIYIYNFLKKASK